MLVSRRSDVDARPGSLAYGSFSVTGPGPGPGSGVRRLAVRVGDRVLDLSGLAARLRLPYAELLRGPVLNPLLAAGPATWARLDADLAEWLGSAAIDAELLRPAAVVELHLAF